ncbi:hypothetical protein GCM10011581_00310 [Saccharopolyspora subtropica]|uniref:Uncharacterized protein n=1 Tax=Saccharopolyspora thermophila TaxID=89367 RepID=A0A917JJK8_9PSEU|nr:hypothetical protein [Saccharopolyspora subtropica]GGI67427.1 hypothetical protein GCM10011581_00310 [Saccharopolyspora subtropica]
MTWNIAHTAFPAEHRRFRAVVGGVDPDAIYRAVHEAGGFRSWDEPSRDLLHLRSTAIEVYRVGDRWVLAVNGPSVEAVREVLRLLGLGADRDVQELKGA